MQRQRRKRNAAGRARGRLAGAGDRPPAPRQPGRPDRRGHRRDGKSARAPRRHQDALGSTIRKSRTASAPSRWSNPTTACCIWACCPRAAVPAFSSRAAVPTRAAAAGARRRAAAPAAVDALTPDLYSGQSDALPVGAGWLPPEWYGESTILDAVRHAMKIPAGRLRGYGHPLGFPVAAPAPGRHACPTSCSRSSRNRCC